MQTSMNTRRRLQGKARAICIRYASDELRRDRKVVITAMLNHPGSLVYCLDETLKAELSGLSKSQLHALLETADQDMVPQDKEDIEPPDEIHSCLFCFDLGALCTSCAAAQGKPASPTSSSLHLESKPDLLLIEKPSKKSKKKKKKKKNNHCSPEETKSAKHDELISQFQDRHSTQNIDDDDNDVGWGPIDDCWASNVSHELTKQQTRSKSLNLALLRTGFDFDKTNSLTRFLILGADAREGNTVNETLGIFSETIHRLFTNNKKHMMVEFSLFGPNISPSLHGKTFKFLKYGSVEFAEGSHLIITYSNELYHETSAATRARPFVLSVCFNSGFWGYPDWLPTLVQVLCPGSSPLLLTAYSGLELEDDIECLEKEIPHVLHSTSTLWGPEVNPMRSLVERPSSASEENFENHSWLCLSPAATEAAPVPCPPRVTAVLRKYGICSTQHQAFLAELVIASNQDDSGETR